MKRTTAIGSASLALCLAIAMPATTASAHGGERPTTFSLTGDPVVGATGGSKFEGIGLDERTGAFYVSEVTGGEIHRGQVSRADTAQWLDGDGTDGRFTARGVTVDDAGRVYVAGGPNAIDHPGAPDLWVYSQDGRLLTALRTGVPNAFLNDVAIGPDGAAYFTNSNAPQVFRVAKKGGVWSVKTWADATGTITTSAGFNLGGIVVSPDRRSLVVAQGNAGKLWRFDLRSRGVSPIDIGDANLVNADGLVLQGRTLWVVRNFSRVLTTLHLGPNAATARLVSEQPTDPDRVFTTAKFAQGRLLLVDSKFDENPVGLPPYQVVALDVQRG
ncbi:MAG: SMP-30/gluconolactonase/LRE family protein [Propionibacteriaceae bacterium]